jgi:lipoprotein-releasing system ATP-binding protein
MKSVLQAEHIDKYFHRPVEFQVLKDISFVVGAGEFVSIMGKSGCGKSTLLYVLSTMDTDYQGELTIEGERMTGLDQTALARIRNEKIGFVFQFHYLLPEFKVLDNVMIPALKLGRKSREEIEDKAYGLLKALGIADQATKRANRISGGQKQRVAIARALINDPAIMMGDEPTGNLDSRNSDIVFEIFRELAADRGQSLLVVTHDEDFAARTDRIIWMDDGRIIDHDYHPHQGGATSS